MTEGILKETIRRFVTDSPEDEGDARDLPRALGLGMEIATAFLLPIGAGIWIDGRWVASPLGILLGIFLGMGLAGSALYRNLRGDGRRRAK